MATSKSTTGKYVVAHTLIDKHPEGTILYSYDSTEDFGEKKWADGARKFDTQEQQERLVIVGAIRDMTAEELEANPDALRLPGPIPSGFGEPIPSKREYAVMQGAQAKAKAEAEKAAASPPPHAGGHPAPHTGPGGGTAAKPK